MPLLFAYCKVSTSEILLLWLVSAAEQAGLSLEDRFSRVAVHMIPSGYIYCEGSWRQQKRRHAQSDQRSCDLVL